LRKLLARITFKAGYESRFVFAKKAGYSAESKDGEKD